jgi:hypothetical protein
MSKLVIWENPDKTKGSILYYDSETGKAYLAFPDTEEFMPMEVEIIKGEGEVRVKIVNVKKWATEAGKL